MPWRRNCAQGNLTREKNSQKNYLRQNLQFVHDGSNVAPTYSVQTPNIGIALTPAPQAATITFYQRPVLSTNTLLIHQGEGVPITSILLGIMDDYPASQVNFTISNLQHGQFKSLPFNNTVTQFSEQQLLSGAIAFTQDGTASAPSYQVGVSDPYFTLPPVLATVTFYPQPTLVCNPLVIHQGESVPVTSILLQVTDNYPPNQVNFTVNNVQHGNFTLLPSGISAMQFSEQQLLAGKIAFVQDGSASAPSYQVGMNDLYFTLPPASPASITFYRRPILLNNQLLIHQGETRLITTWNVNTTDDYLYNQVNLVMSNVQHGSFKLLPANNSVMQFTLQQLLTEKVTFVQDDSVVAPSYQVSVTDPFFTLSSVPANITFYLRPVLDNNQLVIHQGESVILDAAFLSVSDDYPSNQVNFTISNIQHGQFKLSPLNTPITQFSEQQLLSGNILFTHDGSSSPPSYQVGISDPYFTLPASSAAVTFYRQPALVCNPLTIHQGESISVTSVLLQVMDSYPSNQVNFTVSNVQQGQFKLLPASI